MLKAGLEDAGSSQNKIDPCLSVRNKCIVILYVVDCCIFTKYKDTIDALLKIYQIQSSLPMKRMLSLILV